jgi:hypothetical protein
VVEGWGREVFGIGFEKGKDLARRRGMDGKDGADGGAGDELISDGLEDEDESAAAGVDCLFE